MGIGEIKNKQVGYGPMVGLGGLGVISKFNKVSKLARLGMAGLSTGALGWQIGESLRLKTDPETGEPIPVSTRLKTQLKDPFTIGLALQAMSPIPVIGPLASKAAGMAFGVGMANGAFETRKAVTEQNKQSDLAGDITAAQSRVDSIVSDEKEVPEREQAQAVSNLTSALARQASSIKDPRERANAYLGEVRYNSASPGQYVTNQLLNEELPANALKADADTVATQMLDKREEDRLVKRWKKPSTLSEIRRKRPSSMSVVPQGFGQNYFGE